MRVAYEMKYCTEVAVSATIHLVPYVSEYQEKYKRMYNDCYHDMREALQIEPYDFIQDDTFFDSGMDSVYLLFEAGELIGSVALKEDEIDDLLVARKYQGKGYGKQLLLWAIEHSSAKHPVLHVAGWNERAVQLYKSVGFEIVNTIYF